MEQIIFEKLRDYEMILPHRNYDEDVGYDLRYYPSDQQNNILYTGDIEILECGFRLQLPKDYFGMICSRSGLATKGVFVVNAPGIIDPGYRGEICVILGNIQRDIYKINCGEKIAQLVILPVSQLHYTYGQVNVEETERGEKGFGSSGKV